MQIRSKVFADRQTDKQRWLHNLLGGGNCNSFFSSADWRM